MTTSKGLDNQGYAGINTGELLHHINSGRTGRIEYFNFERGDVYPVIKMNDGQLFSDLLETFEFVDEVQ